MPEKNLHFVIPPPQQNSYSTYKNSEEGKGWGKQTQKARKCHGEDGEGGIPVVPLSKELHHSLNLDSKDTASFLDEVTSKKVLSSDKMISKKIIW